MLFLFLGVSAICTLSDMLSTKPNLTNNILASGYVNFTVRACFNSTLYSLCSWKHGSFEFEYYSIFQGCFELTLINGTYFNKCTKMNNVIEATLTHQVPVPLEHNLFTMKCSTGGMDSQTLSINTSVFVQSKYAK